MARESLYFADDFGDEVRALADPKMLAEKSVIMQFPFTAPVRPLSDVIGSSGWC